MSIRSNYIYSVTGQAAQVLTLTLFTLFTARALGKAGQGELAVVISLANLIAGATSLSLPQGTIFFLSSRRADPPVLVMNAVLAATVLGGATALCVWLGADWLLRLTRLGLPLPLWVWVAVLIPTTQFAEFGNAFHAGERRFATLAMVNAIVGAVFVCVVWPTLKDERATVTMACLLFFGYRILRIAVLWGTFPRAWRNGLRAKGEVLLQTARYSLQAHGGVVLLMAVYRLDLLILTGMAGPAAAGVYSVAVMFAESITHLGQSLSRVVLPEVAARDADDARTIGARVLRQTFWATAACAIVLGLAVYWLIPWLVGREYAESIVAVWLLLPGIVVLASTRVCLQAVAGGGWPWVISVAASVGLTLTVVCDVLLIPRWGVRGAAVASTLAYAIQWMFTLLLYARQTHVSWSDMVAFRMDDYRMIGAVLKRVFRA